MASLFGSQRIHEPCHPSLSDLRAPRPLWECVRRPLESREPQVTSFAHACAHAPLVSNSREVWACPCGRGIRRDGRSYTARSAGAVLGSPTKKILGQDRLKNNAPYDARKRAAPERFVVSPAPRVLRRDRALRASRFDASIVRRLDTTRAPRLRTSTQNSHEPGKRGKAIASRMLVTPVT